MANKQSASKKTANTSVDKSAAGAGSARVAQPATSRVKTVKHSKATVTEPISIMESVIAAGAPTTTQVVAIPTEDRQAAVAQIAYGYWMERGCQGGSQTDDWFRAEAAYNQLLATR